MTSFSAVVKLGRVSESQPRSVLPSGLCDFYSPIPLFISSPLVSLHVSKQPLMLRERQVWGSEGERKREKCQACVSQI